MITQKSNRILIAVILACIVFLLWIYADGYEENYDKDAKRFAAVICTGGYYWEDIQTGIQNADKEFGTYTKYMMYERFNLQDQIGKLEKADYMNIDGIITVGEPGSKEVNEMLLYFQEKGIPVALVDTDAPESGRNYYIGMDNYKAGKLAAQKVIEATNQKARILVVTSRLDSSNQKIRLDGFSDEIETYEDMEIVSVIQAGKDKKVIDEKVRQAFEQWTDINVVFCEENFSTTQIGYIIESDEKYSDIDIVGFDINASTLEFIKNGTYLGVIKMDGLETGYEAVRHLYEAKDVETTEYYRDIVFVDNSNVKEFYNLNESE